MFGLWRLLQLHAGVQRQLVLDVEIDIDGPRSDAGAQRGRHSPIRPLVERHDVLGHRAEIRQRAFIERTGAGLDFLQVEIARILDPDVADFHLRDAEGYIAVRDILVPYGDADRLKASVVIFLL